jgi:hypothetical protein
MEKYGHDCDFYDDKECNHIINLIGKKNIFKHQNNTVSMTNSINDENNSFGYDPFDDKECNDLINLIGKRNLFKHKTNTMNNNPTVMRAIRNRINTKHNKVLNDVLSIQFRASR